jgi:hypothetical protein
MTFIVMLSNKRCKLPHSPPGPLCVIYINMEILCTFLHTGPHVEINELFPLLLVISQLAVSMYIHTEGRKESD